MSGKWAVLQRQFLTENEQVKITVQEFCNKNGLKYDTARRYIKAQKLSAITKVKKEIAKQDKHKSIIKVAKSIRQGAYSHYFDSDIATIAAETLLSDELELCRSRIHLVVRAINEINKRLIGDDVNAEVAASLYESLFKADTALDRNIQRVESITKTLSSIRIDDLHENKIKADTDKSLTSAKVNKINLDKFKAQTKLTELHIEKAKKELGGSSQLDEYLNTIISSKIDKVVS